MKKLSFLLTLMLALLFASAKAQTPGENIDVTNYTINLWGFDFTEHTLQGEACIDFTATANTNIFVLELKSLTVESVISTFSVGNSFVQEGDLLIVTTEESLAAGQTGRLIIRYGGSTFSETWGGVEWWGTDYVYNLGVGFDSQPHNLGKAWFPCVDNFTDKATYDLNIVTTNDKKAICGGNLVETFDNGDGTTTWHWNTPQEIATYHISFAVGDYEVWEDVYHGIERDIPIEVYAKPNQMSLVPGTFVHIQEIVSFFEEHLGAYPFNRIGYISTGKGCMEHTDNIAFAASIINGNTSGEEYIAHELSHMWSGNLVTCATAGDMWLNEGFAQFWGAFYEVGVYGEQHFQNTMSTLVNNINTWCNSSNNWMPLNNMPLDMTYDGTAIYDRGAVIVNTMMNYMGRENFLAAMRNYFQQYAYQAATSENLRDALTQYSSIDMNGFFDSYVFASGMPHPYASIASVTPVGNQFEVTLDLRYQHIGDSHIGQNNRYEVTFIGPEFQLATEQVNWDGLHGSATVTLDFEPVGMVNDFNNNWLDGRTQTNFMLKNTSSQSFNYFAVKPETLTDSVFVSFENHFVGPYDDPLIPYLNLSTKHFWTVNRYDFGEAQVTANIDFSRTIDNDIIHSANDSATLLYRKDASEAWHEIAYTLYPGSTWKQGRFIVDDFQSGDYAIAAWDKEALGAEEFVASVNRMQVFPNPADKQVTVSWNEKVNALVELCDTNGRVVCRRDVVQADQVTLSLEGLAKGSYVVRLMRKDGSVMETETLIIK